METERARAGQGEEESGQVEEREIKTQEGTSLVVQWLGLQAPSVRGPGELRFHMPSSVTHTKKTQEGHGIEHEDRMERRHKSTRDATSKLDGRSE